MYLGTKQGGKIITGHLNNNDYIYIWCWISIICSAKIRLNKLRRNNIGNIHLQYCYLFLNQFFSFVFCFVLFVIYFIAIIYLYTQALYYQRTPSNVCMWIFWNCQSNTKYIHVYYVNSAIWFHASQFAKYWLYYYFFFYKN